MNHKKVKILDDFRNSSWLIFKYIKSGERDDDA